MRRRLLRALAGLAALATACTPAVPVNPTAGPVGAPAGRWREQFHHVPVRDAAGRDVLMVTRICRPQGERPARVVLINHGSPVSPTARRTQKPYACDSEAVGWFLARGFVVVLPLRRGYGATGGDYAETSAGCRADAFVRAARETARDIEAARAYAAALAFVRPDNPIIVGQSAGGWGTLGYNSLPHPAGISLVSMAGGRGGRQNDIAHLHCGPAELIKAAAELGRSAASPMLWIYTENDTFFSPLLAQAMADAYGGHGAAVHLYRLDAWGEDGHRLFTGRGGSSIWGPLLAEFLSTRPGGITP